MSKRFRKSTAIALAAHLRDSGVDPSARTGPPSRSLDGGCSDPGCCSPHPGVTSAGEAMLDVVTTVSGSELHRVAIALARAGG